MYNVISWTTQVFDLIVMYILEIFFLKLGQRELDPN